MGISRIYAKNHFELVDFTCVPYTSKSCKDNEYVICIFELSTNALLVLDVRAFFLHVFSVVGVVVVNVWVQWYCCFENAFSTWCTRISMRLMNTLFLIKWANNAIPFRFACTRFVNNNGRKCGLPFVLMHVITCGRRGLLPKFLRVCMDFNAQEINLSKTLERMLLFWVCIYCQTNRILFISKQHSSNKMDKNRKFVNRTHQNGKCMFVIFNDSRYRIRIYYKVFFMVSTKQSTFSI